MKVGTKSLLFGVHCFFIHPIVVAIAWTKLYGFPRDFRLWIAFVVHDWGYWGKPNMDGEEGKSHVHLGANIMLKLFGYGWGEFTRLHSRSYSDANNVCFSSLCVADKYAIVIEPYWLYMLRARLSGELNEYMSNHCQSDSRKWHFTIKTYFAKWCIDNHLRPRIYYSIDKN